MYFKTQDHIKLYYELLDHDCRSDAPVCVVFPGGPGLDFSVYKPQVDFLKSHYKILLFDPRGCGQSEASPEQQYSFSVFADDVVQLLRHLNFKKVSIIGTSYGSMAAQYFALHHSELLSAMVLICGSPSYHFLEQAKKNLENRGSEEQIDFCQRFLWPGKFQSQADFATFGKMMAPMYIHSFTAETATQKSPFQKGCNLDALNQTFASDFEQFDFRDQLRQIKLPILWLIGEHDWINDPSLIEEVCQRIPNCQLHIIKECGHSVFADAQEKYIKYVSDFLKEFAV